jgi:hypothetical protein
VTIVFKNDAGVDYEGELTFPLEEGATVCGYAVDIEGQLVDAVVCEKEKARVAFETEVREKRAGPAIAEQVAGSNVFRTKIYPLPAHGQRTVRVCVAAELADTAAGASYVCPLRANAVVDSFRLAAQVDASTDVFEPPLLSDAVNETLGRQSFV